MNLEQARFNMIEQQIRTWDVLDTDVHDSIKTMALVDAALKSSRLGGVVPEAT